MFQLIFMCKNVVCLTIYDAWKMHIVDQWYICMCVHMYLYKATYLGDAIISLCIVIQCWNIAFKFDEIIHLGLKYCQDDFSCAVKEIFSHIKFSDS